MRIWRRLWGTERVVVAPPGGDRWSESSHRRSPARDRPPERSPHRSLARDRPPERSPYRSLARDRPPERSPCPSLARDRPGERSPRSPLVGDRLPGRSLPDLLPEIASGNVSPAGLSREIAGDRGRSMPSKLPCAVCVEGPRHLTWRAPPQGNRCLVPTLDGHPLLAPTLLQVARRTPDSRADTMRCPDPRGRSAQHLSACRCSAPWVATGPAGSPRQGAQRRSTRSRRGRCSSTARRRAAGGPSAPREKVCAAKVEPKLNPVTEPRSARHGQQRRGSVRAEEVRCRIDRIVNMANAAVEWGNA